MKITEQGGGTSFSGARARITIISPGQGSSGYYPPEVIAEAAPLFEAGTHMYLDHATETERAERGVRSLDRLVGVLESAPTLNHNGALVADVKIMPAWRDFVKEAYPYIGVSISASGEIEESEQGRVVKKLTAVESVDFVTKAGRGGKIDALLESAVTKEDLSESTEKEGGMTVTITEAEHKALTEAAETAATATSKAKELEAKIAELTKELDAEKAKAAQAQESAQAATAEAVKAQATAIVEEAFQGIAAPAGKARLIEAVQVDNFDAEAFRATVTEAAAEYAPASPVKGMGATPATGNTITESDIITEFGGK